MEQEGGDKGDKIYITEVKTGKITEKTTTLIFSYEKENKSSKKKDGYNYDYDSIHDQYNYKFYFKDENFRTLFKMLFERVLKYKIKLEKGKIRIPLDKIDKQQMKLDTVYIEVSNFGTKEKKISSILKKNDNDNNYVNLKDDEFISYLTKSGLDKNAVKLIIAIYVTNYVKSSGEPPITTNKDHINTNNDQKDIYLNKGTEPRNSRISYNNVNTGQVSRVHNDNDDLSKTNELNTEDEFFDKNETFTIILSNLNNKELWNKLKKTLSDDSKYNEIENKVTIKKNEFTQDDFEKLKKSDIILSLF
jgi:hypothetical protein